MRIAVLRAVGMPLSLGGRRGCRAAPDSRWMEPDHGTGRGRGRCWWCAPRRPARPARRHPGPAAAAGAAGFGQPGAELVLTSQSATARLNVPGAPRGRSHATPGHRCRSAVAGPARRCRRPRPRGRRPRSRSATGPRGGRRPAASRAGRWRRCPAWRSARSWPGSPTRSAVVPAAAVRSTRPRPRVWASPSRPGRTGAGPVTGTPLPASRAARRGPSSAPPRPPPHRGERRPAGRPMRCRLAQPDGRRRRPRPSTVTATPVPPLGSTSATP